MSAYYSVVDVLEAILSKDDIQSKKFFYKTIGMNKWEAVEDLSVALA